MALRVLSSLFLVAYRARNGSAARLHLAPSGGHELPSSRFYTRYRGADHHGKRAGFEGGGYLARRIKPALADNGCAEIRD